MTFKFIGGAGLIGTSRVAVACTLAGMRASIADFRLVSAEPSSRTVAGNLLSVVLSATCWSLIFRVAALMYVLMSSAMLLLASTNDSVVMLSSTAFTRLLVILRSGI